MTIVGSPLTDWLKRIEALSARGIDLGLERVERVLSRLQLTPPKFVFHVAGTNGKGSSVAMLEMLLRSSSASVGSYTSPHIICYNERIRIDGDDATDEQIVGAFERIEAVRDDEALTYFEFGTLAALVIFADAGIETVILEVGMGGRLDAVNAIEPDAGLITNISLDHCDWLGNDVESIAIEKAGIMRKDTPIIFASRDLPQSILQRADDIGAHLLVVGRDYDWTSDGDTWSWQGKAHQLTAIARPRLPGDHQMGNAAAVLALLEAAGRDDLLSNATVSNSLGKVDLPGRLQEVNSNARWLLDVAHNPAAASALASALNVESHAGRTVAIVGMLEDKDVSGVITALIDQVDHWIAVTADNPRAISAGELARQVANTSNSACLTADSVEAAVDRARELSGPADRVLITGSFYLVGPVLKQLYSRR